MVGGRGTGVPTAGVLARLVIGFGGLLLVMVGLGGLGLYEQARLSDRAEAMSSRDLLPLASLR